MYEIITSSFFTTHVLASRNNRCLALIDDSHSKKKKKTNYRGVIERKNPSIIRRLFFDCFLK